MSGRWARWRIAAAAFGLVVAAVAAGPGSADDMQWHSGTFIDEQNKGGPSAYLIYGAPETDDAQFNASCSAKSDNRTASAVLAYNTGRRSEGAKVIVKFFDDSEAVYQKPGRVSGTKAEEGVSGVTFNPSAHDYLWQVLSRDGALSYRIDGGVTSTISLRGAADPIRTFTETCRSIFDGTYTAGTEVPSPEFGQPSFSPPQSPPEQFGEPLEQFSPPQFPPPQLDQPQLAAPQFSPSPSGPSFSCDGNIGSAERTICDSPELAKYDRQMAEVYEWLNGELKAEDRNSLHTNQQQWLAKRNSCGTDTDCILDLYLDRIAYMNEYFMP